MWCLRILSPLRVLPVQPFPLPHLFYLEKKWGRKRGWTGKEVGQEPAREEASGHTAAAYLVNVRSHAAAVGPLASFHGSSRAFSLEDGKRVDEPWGSVSITARNTKENLKSKCIFFGVLLAVIC